MLEKGLEKIQVPEIWENLKIEWCDMVLGNMRKIVPHFGI